MSPNYPCRIDWARLFACSMLLRGSVMKKRLSFIIIGHCFFPFKVITDQAFQWLNYNRKENIACMLKIKRALKKIMSKSYISITGKFLWPFRNLMQFPIMQAKFQAVYVLMKMLHCHIRYIYIHMIIYMTFWLWIYHVYQAYLLI